jgi:phosphoglycolate phosphatase
MSVLLLDLDRTLVDVEHHVDYCAALEAIEGVVAPVEASAEPETAWGPCTRRAIEALVALSGTPGWLSVSRSIEAFEIAGAERSTAMPGLGEFLAAAGDRPVGIVTLLGPHAAETTLATHRIDVRCVVARRADLRPKPYPDQVREALRILGASPEDALMVGDSERDEASATAAGVRFLGITNGRERHGFTRAIAVVPSLLEAAAWLPREPHPTRVAGGSAKRRSSGRGRSADPSPDPDDRA